MGPSPVISSVNTLFPEAATFPSGPSSAFKSLVSMSYRRRVNTRSGTEISTCPSEDSDGHQPLAYVLMQRRNLGIGIEQTERFIQLVRSFTVHGISSLRSIESDDENRFVGLNTSAFPDTGCTLSSVTCSAIRQRGEVALRGEDHSLPFTTGFPTVLCPMF